MATRRCRSVWFAQLLASFVRNPRIIVHHLSRSSQRRHCSLLSDANWFPDLLVMQNLCAPGVPLPFLLLRLWFSAQCIAQTSNGNVVDRERLALSKLLKLGFINTKTSKATLYRIAPYWRNYAQNGKRRNRQLCFYQQAEMNMMPMIIAHKG